MKPIRTAAEALTLLRSLGDMPANEAAERLSEAMGEPRPVSSHGKAIACLATCRPYVTRRPDVLGGAPCIVGTRVPLSTLAPHLLRGTVTEFLAEYPHVDADTVSAIEAAYEVEVKRVEAEARDLFLARAARAGNPPATMLAVPHTTRICGAQSPGDPDDEDNPPVTCTREPGHEGQHAGGMSGGTVEWEKAR